MVYCQAFYKESKKRFDTDAAFKERAQKAVIRLQGESFYNPYIPKVIEALSNQGLIEVNEDARVIFIEGFKIPLIVVKKDGGYNSASTDLAALWYRLNEEKADWIIYVTDVGQQQHFDMVFSAAKRAGWLPDDDGTYPKASHVGFGLVLGEDGKRFRTRSSEVVRLVDLLDEAKTGSIVLDHVDERMLGLHLMRFSEVVEEACSNLLPSVLCDYFYNLSEYFTKFYLNCQVSGSAEETSRLLLCEATNHSHVPEFGCWDKISGDKNNVRYTTCFDDARKAKAVEKMNPGDLEASVNNDTEGLDNPLDANSDKNNSGEKSSREGSIGRNLRERKIYNQLKSASNKSGTSESGSDISNSDHSLRQSGQLRLKSDQKIGRSEGSSKHSRNRSGSNRSDESAHRRIEALASVPKFGDWDENDPKSSEGFTAIFEKLKEEKQIASTKEIATCIYSDTPKNNRGSSYKSKMFCCLFPSIKD
ncbi:hypothetical protein QYF36_020245 [Acer negundo]|nr:hypothetical protein QYF36_020245 [Acer negundo]